MWVDECFFWYRLTRVVQEKIQSHKTVVCLCVCVQSIELNGTNINDQWPLVSLKVTFVVTTDKMHRAVPLQQQSFLCHPQPSLGSPEPGPYLRQTTAIQIFSVSCYISTLFQTSKKSLIFSCQMLFKLFQWWLNSTRIFMAFVIYQYLEY